MYETNKSMNVSKNILKIKIKMFSPLTNIYFYDLLNKCFVYFVFKVFFILKDSYRYIFKLFIKMKNTL